MKGGQRIEVGEKWLARFVDGVGEIGFGEGEGEGIGVCECWVRVSCCTTVRPASLCGLSPCKCA